MEPNLSLGAGRMDTFLVAMDESSLFVWETSLFVVDTFLVATPHSRGPVPPSGPAESTLCPGPRRSAFFCRVPPCCT